MPLSHWFFHALVSFTPSPWQQTTDPLPDLLPGTPVQSEVTDDDPEVFTDALDEMDLEDPVRGKTYLLRVPESGPYHVDLHSHFFDA